MGYESLMAHYDEHELGYYLRMLLVSFFSSLQLSIMMAYLYKLTALYQSSNELLWYAFLLIMVQWLTPIIARLVNSRWLLTTCKNHKFAMICTLQFLAWILFILPFILCDQDGPSTKKPSSSQELESESDITHSEAA